MKRCTLALIPLCFLGCESSIWNTPATTSTCAPTQTETDTNRPAVQPGFGLPAVPPTSAAIPEECDLQGRLANCAVSVCDGRKLRLLLEAYFPTVANGERTVTFHLAPCRYVVSYEPGATPYASLGRTIFPALRAGHNLIIEGHGAVIEQGEAANVPARFFYVDGGNLTLRDVTLKGGGAQGGAGGRAGGLGYAGGGGAGLGGAIFAHNATIDLIRVIFSGNRAVGGAGGLPPSSTGTFGGGGGGGMSGNGTHSTTYSGGGGGGALLNAEAGGWTGGGFLAPAQGGNAPGFSKGGVFDGSGPDVPKPTVGQPSPGARDAADVLLRGGDGGQGNQMGGPGGGGGLRNGGDANKGSGGYSGGGGGALGGGGGGAGDKQSGGGGGGFGGGGGGGSTNTTQGAGGFAGGTGIKAGGGGGGLGGAVFFWGGSTSKLNVVNCEFLDNVAQGGASGGEQAGHGAGYGGAIFSLGSPEVLIKHSTFYGNTAIQPGPTGVMSIPLPGAAIAEYRYAAPPLTAGVREPSFAIQSSILRGTDVSQPLLAAFEQGSRFQFVGINVVTSPQIGGSPDRTAQIEGTGILVAGADALDTEPRRIPPPTDLIQRPALVAPEDKLATFITAQVAKPERQDAVVRAREICSSTPDSPLNVSPDLRGAGRSQGTEICWPGAIELTPAIGAPASADDCPRGCETAPGARRAPAAGGLLALLGLAVVLARGPLQSRRRRALS